MAEALPIRLLKNLANFGPVSLLDVDEIECACVLATRAGSRRGAYGMPLRQNMRVLPMTVGGLTPDGVKLARRNSTQRTSTQTLPGEHGQRLGAERRATI